MAEASDFKFGSQIGFAKTHHKITPTEKSGCGLGLRELPKILGFPYNISATAEVSNFKIIMLLGFAKTLHKISQRKISGRNPGLENLPIILEFLFNICANG